MKLLVRTPCPQPDIVAEIPRDDLSNRSYTSDFQVKSVCSMPRSCASLFSKCCVSMLFWWLLTVAASSDAQRVDCRKFVFAPLCRGVAAKRAYSSSQDDFYLDNSGKLGGLSKTLDSYPTMVPMMGSKDNGLAKERNRMQIQNQDLTWKVADDQGLKADTMYDWYLQNRKRNREQEIAYDY